MQLNPHQAAGDLPRPSVQPFTAVLLVVALPLLLWLRTQLGETAGHIDEYDYLFVGKTLLSGQQWPSHTYIFGWDISWLLYALADRTFGGLEGARLVAACLGGLSIIGMYTFVYTLWRNHTTALIAAVLLGFEAAHLYTSRLATYDIICFTAFIWSLPAIILATRPIKYRLLWTLIACLLLCIAVLSKYTALVYLPLIAVAVLVLAPRQGIVGVVVIILALCAYTFMHFEDLGRLYTIQINSTHGANGTTYDILARTARQLLVLLLFTAFSFLHACHAKDKTAIILFILLLFSAPLFIYHLATQNVISLQKHLAFASLFLIPIVAWWLQNIYDKHSYPKLRCGIVLTCILAFALANLEKLKLMQLSYPDVSNFQAYAERMQNTDSVLSENPYLFRYWLADKVDQSQIRETSWIDNNWDGKYEHRDIRQAIWDRKFTYVFLNDQQHAQLNHTLRNMLDYRDYELLLEKPYQLETMSGAKRFGTMGLYRNNYIAPTLTHTELLTD